MLDFLNLYFTFKAGKEIMASIVDVPEKVVNVALAGGGVVGGGVVEILKTREEYFASLGVKFCIKKVLVNNINKKRDYTLPEGAVFTTNLDDIVSDPVVDLVVEVMGGVTDARTVVFGALEAGKSVVTANKALISKYMPELEKTLEDVAEGVFFAYEASVGGGIPIIKSLQRDTVRVDEITQISGILNGTTNYMLSKMNSSGCSYEEALKEAQVLGFAEAEPTADVEGYDARSKTSVLCRLGLGLALKEEDISCRGISCLTSDDFAYAKMLNSTIKLLGICKRSTSGTVRAFVSPVLVPNSNIIVSTNGSTNIIEVRSKSLNVSSYVGSGAGRFPTANSVVADMVEVALGNTPKAFPMKKKGQYEKDFSGRFYIRINVRDCTGIIKTVGTICENFGVSINAVLQTPIENPESLPFVVTTDKTTASKVQTVCEALKENTWCLGRPLALPFL